MWQNAELAEARPAWQCENAVAAAESAALAARERAADTASTTAQRVVNKIALFPPLLARTHPAYEDLSTSSQIILTQSTFTKDKDVHTRSFRTDAVCTVDVLAHMSDFRCGLNCCDSGSIVAIPN